MKLCPVCNVQIEQQTRVTCSLVCRQRYISKFAADKKKAEARERIKLNSIECLNCGKLTVNKKFCSRSCAASVNNSTTPKRRSHALKCTHCGKNTSNKLGICPTCRAIDRKKSWTAIWLQNGDPIGMPGCGTVKVLRKALLEEFGPACWECLKIKVNPHSGFPLIEMDHVDGNRQNNKRKNLRLLCPDCHAMTPTYKHLNRASKVLR